MYQSNLFGLAGPRPPRMLGSRSIPSSVWAPMPMLMPKLSRT
jgi:hypothetical protein